jgi:hypothetical protein
MGGLTVAAEAGVPESIMWMQSGHTQSMAARRYVRLTDPDRLYDTWRAVRLLRRRTMPPHIWRIAPPTEAPTPQLHGPEKPRVAALCGPSCGPFLPPHGTRTLELWLTLPRCGPSPSPARTCGTS